MTGLLPAGAMLFALNLAGIVGLCAILIMITDWRAAQGTQGEAKARASARKSLWPRFRVWSVAAVVLWLALVIGPIGLGLLLAAMAWVAAREFLTVTQAPLGVTPALVSLPILSAAFVGASGALLGTFVALAALPVLAWRHEMTRTALTRVALQMLAVIWIGGALASIVVLRQTDMGLGLVGWVLLVVALSDVMAMFGGLAGGKHHIAPRLSSGKTAEGLVAGLLGACLAALLVRPVLPDPGWAVLLVTSMGLAGISVVGDLVASWVKRCVDASDFGTSLPGHGGVLDRIDSLLYAGPAGLVLAFYVFGAVL